MPASSLAKRFITAISSLLDDIASTRGAILFRGVSSWEALTPGTAGKVLQSNGAGASPTWEAAAGGSPFASDISVNSIVAGRGGGNVSSNTVFGNSALNSNSTGAANAAFGYLALQSGTGSNNAAMGGHALAAVTSGAGNTGQGAYAGYNITTGSNNTILGYNTGLGITTGGKNTIIGANVTGLSSSLANNIIIADGDGNRRINVDASGRVGIGTNSPSAHSALDITSTTGGLLVPRMTTTQRDAFSPLGPINGVIIYNTTTNKFQGGAGSNWVDLH